MEPSKNQFILTYILFYALGVITNVPANFFTTANDYWMYKFRDFKSNESYDSNNKTAMQTEFTGDYSIVTNVGNIVFIIITVKYIRTKVNMFYRLVGCLVASAALLIFTCIFVNAETDSWQRGFFVLTLIIALLLTGIGGTFMVTLFEAASKFPKLFLATVFSGQSICGILSSLVQVLALGVGGGPQNTGLIYFLIGLMFVLLTLVAFLMSWYKNEFFQHHLTKPLLPTRKKLEFSKEILLSGLNKSKFYQAALSITLFTSLLLHPGVINLVVSVDKGNGVKWNDIFFGPVVNFLFYFLFDYVGRELAQILQKPTSSVFIFVLSCLRLSFVPLFLYCNEQPRQNLPVVFGDAPYICFLILFAFTNGFIVNLSIIRIPLVTNEGEMPFAMLIMLLLLVLSMTIGSAISTTIVNAL